MAAAVNAPPVATTYEYGGAQQGHNPYDTYNQGGGGAYQWPHAQYPAPHQVFSPEHVPVRKRAQCDRGRAAAGRGLAGLAPHELTLHCFLCSLTPGALRTMLRRRMGNSTHGGRKPRHGLPRPRERTRGSGASSRSSSRLGSSHSCTNNSMALTATRRLRRRRRRSSHSSSRRNSRSNSRSSRAGLRVPVRRCRRQ